jgi:uncharacterized OB-fold protein
MTASSVSPVVQLHSLWMSGSPSDTSFRHSPVQNLAETAEGLRLIAGSCAACTRPHFPRADVCPWCGHPDTDVALIGATGRLWAWTAVTTSPPGYAGELPYGFGVVEVSEGLRVVTRLTEADPARLAAGMPMRLVSALVDAADGMDPMVIWAYTPAEP